MKKIEKTKRFQRIASLIAALGFIYFAFWLRFGFVPGPFVFIIVLSISIMFFIVPIFIPDKNSKTINSDNENRKIVNKIIYFKKGFLLRRIIIAILGFYYAFIMLTGAFSYIMSGDPIVSIFYLSFFLLLFISSYQTIKQPYVEFKDDEISIQRFTIFCVKEKIKLNDIEDFKTGKYLFEKCIIFTLKNDKIKRFRLGGISIADQEYIINFLKEKIEGDKNSKSVDSDNDKGRNNE